MNDKKREWLIGDGTERTHRTSQLESLKKPLSNVRLYPLVPLVPALLCFPLAARAGTPVTGPELLQNGSLESFTVVSDHTSWYYRNQGDMDLFPGFGRHRWRL